MDLCCRSVTFLLLCWKKGHYDKDRLVFAVGARVPPHWLVDMKIQNSASAHLFKMTRGRLILDLFLAAFIMALVWLFASVLWMPGSSFAGQPPPLTEREQ